MLLPLLSVSYFALSSATDLAFVSSASTAYTPAEDVEITFSNPSPTEENWIGIADAGSDVDGELPDGLLYEAWKYTKRYEAWEDSCGTKDCEGTASEGEINFGTLLPGKYQAYLLDNDEEAPYTIKASSVIFTIKGEPSSACISASKTAYTPAEDVAITFDDPLPTEESWIAISEATFEIVHELPIDSYVRGFTTFGESEGEINFSKLPPGLYQAHLLLDDDGEAPYKIKATSPFFTIDGEPGSVSSASSEYTPAEDVVISFRNPYSTEENWIAIINAGSDVDGELPDGLLYEAWKYTKRYEAWEDLCDTEDCEVIEPEGEINFGKLAPGVYQAYLLYDEYAPLTIKASSAIFTVQSDPGPASLSSVNTSFIFTEDVPSLLTEECRSEFGRNLCNSSGLLHNNEC